MNGQTLHTLHAYPVDTLEERDELVTDRVVELMQIAGYPSDLVMHSDTVDMFTAIQFSVRMAAVNAMVENLKKEIDVNTHHFGFIGAHALLSRPDWKTFYPATVGIANTQTNLGRQQKADILRYQFGEVKQAEAHDE